MAMRLDHGTDELEEVHGINVTPFIDVMLVRPSTTGSGAAARSPRDRPLQRLLNA